MDISRVSEILKSEEKTEVFYNDRPVWIQELNDNVAKVGFVDNFEESNVYIKDLYESNWFDDRK
ncbi:MAG: H-type small acid-soluble spore protein [Clostridia bacterium]|nr:H-type small acid-soluble spore protein [Clostridia bacterium]